jgi:hypothetical protein
MTEKKKKTTKTLRIPKRVKAASKELSKYLDLHEVPIDRLDDEWILKIPRGVKDTLSRWRGIKVVCV